jgi:hypothetical protein
VALERTVAPGPKPTFACCSNNETDAVPLNVRFPPSGGVGYDRRIPRRPGVR